MAPRVRKGYLLTGNCSHPKCKRRSIQAEKLQLPLTLALVGHHPWWERCEAHLHDEITLSTETLAKLGHEERVL